MYRLNGNIFLVNTQRNYLTKKSNKGLKYSSTLPILTVLEVSQVFKNVLTLSVTNKSHSMKKVGN